MAKRIVGVDIGFNVLRAAQVRFPRGDRLPIVEKFAERRLPPGVVEYGDVLDAEALAPPAEAELEYAEEDAALAEASDE